MRSSGDFTAVMRRGRRAGSRTLVVHRLDSPIAAQPPLVGFVVPRSVGNAVVRNRVQRRLRHLMRDRIEKMPPGCRLVVRAQPAAADAVDLGAELDRVLSAVLLMDPRGGST